jgi:hypothetical protein
MSNRQMRAWQVSVPLPVELRVFAERKAEREERSVASVIRQFVAEAAAREREGAGDRRRLATAEV